MCLPEGAILRIALRSHAFWAVLADAVGRGALSRTPLINALEEAGRVVLLVGRILVHMNKFVDWKFRVYLLRQPKPTVIEFANHLDAV